MSSAFGFRYAHENPFSYEFACGVCSRVTSEEDLDGMILCEGGCKRIFHMDCIGLSALPDGAASKWACSRCIQRLRACHICSGVEPAGRVSGMLRCSISHCGKLFHKTCLEAKYGDVSNWSVCALHHCAVEGCTAPINDECYFCIFCLKAFHLRCLPEEVEVICENTCVCLDHHFAYKGPSGVHNMQERLLNVDFGRALAKKRVKRTTKDIVDEVDESVPSTVCSPGIEPCRIPENNGLRSLREGDVQLFVANKVCIPYKVPTSVSDEHIILSDDDELVATTKPKEGPVDMSGLNFVKLRINEWICPKPKKVNAEEDDIPALCDCSDDKCGPDCQNRQCFMQCTAQTCKPTRLRQKHGDKQWKSFECGNKPFGSRSAAKQLFKVVSAGGKGMGLVAKRDIEPHEYIIEYIGEVMTVDEWGDRQKQEAPVGSSKHFYVMDLDGDHVVDASRKGNESRLINHSCDPNLETQKWTVNGESRIGLFAVKPISKGQELTFNYQFETFASKPFKCLCGTAKCSGWIGGRSKKRSEQAEKDDIRRKIAKVLPIMMLENLASVDIPIAVTRTDGTRKKDDEIALEEISACNQKIDFFLQYVWAGSVPGEDWVRAGRRCNALHATPFNPAAMLALSVTKIEASFIKERNLMLLRQLHKARRDMARRFYVWPETTRSVERILESNWISDDCCVRCRRTGNLLWCKTCVRSFHQCCTKYGDVLKSDGTTGDYSFTCRRCKRLADYNKRLPPNESLQVPPIRMSVGDRVNHWKARRASYWKHWVLPSLLKSN